METLVRFDGAVAVVLEELVEMGYFKTKSEAIRAGVLELGKEYSIVKTPQDLERGLVARKLRTEEKLMRKRGEKYLSEEKALSRYR